MGVRASIPAPTTVIGGKREWNFPVTGNSLFTVNNTSNNGHLARFLPPIVLKTMPKRNTVVAGLDQTSPSRPCGLERVGDNRHGHQLGYTTHHHPKPEFLANDLWPLFSLKFPSVEQSYRRKF